MYDCRSGSSSTDHMCAVETNRHLMFNRQVDLQEDGERESHEHHKPIVSTAQQRSDTTPV